VGVSVSNLRQHNPFVCEVEKKGFIKRFFVRVQGGSNMTGADLYVNKPHCAAAVRP